MTTVIDVPPGLRGVQVTDTTIGDVRGEEGFYHYRQYAATDLAKVRSLEDVWMLILDGHLPADRAERGRFEAEVAARRRVPDEVLAMLPGVVRAAAAGGPFDGLRSALSLYGSASGLRPLWDCETEEVRDALLSVAAATPVLAAALYRVARGLEPIEPDSTLGHAADYLRMVTGETPEPAATRALEQYLILTVDHGFNSSTFTARVIASTGADPAAAVVGAMGALSGPLHGGAPSRALDTLENIGSADQAEPYLRDLLERGERIMGFGHAVYRTEDPRSEMLKEVAIDLGGPLADLAVEVEDIVKRLLVELRPGRPLYANVEYYAGVVMDRCGLPREMFTPTFAVSRAIGWSANIAEQHHERRLIRPAARYVGPQPPEQVQTFD